MSFENLGLSAPLLQAVAAEGYQTPSPIQAQAIPVVLEGRDIMAAAQTGTGKTAGFTLPILERLSRGERAGSNQVRALVLTPTRELAAQVAASVSTYGRGLPLRSAVVFGGVSINPQMMALRKGVDVLVATPGRLLDLYQQNAVKFQQLEVLVLDEADRMLDMGFIHDIKRILKLLPAKRQNLLFSATFSDDIRQLAKGLVHNPVEIDVSPRNTATRSVEQWISPVDKKLKADLLIELLRTHQWRQTLVFTKTKHGANKLTEYLGENGFKAAAIHGNKSQGARTKALQDFKDAKIQLLIATDIAARGIDIDQLPQVVNFDLPNVPEDYVHRIGRTGRAGATGQAVSLVCADEIKLLQDIERLIQQKLPRKLIDGFEPVHDLPESKTVHKPVHKTNQNKPNQHKPGERPSNRPNNRSGNNRPNGKSSQTHRAGKQGEGRQGEGKQGEGKQGAGKQQAAERNTGNRSAPKPASGNKSLGAKATRSGQPPQKPSGNKPRPKGPRSGAGSSGR